VRTLWSPEVGVFKCRDDRCSRTRVDGNVAVSDDHAGLSGGFA